jgi:hypothetical protein
MGLISVFATTCCQNVHAKKTLKLWFGSILGAIVTSTVTSAGPSFALTPTEAQLAEKLDSIPVFTIGEVDNTTNTLTLLRLVFSNAEEEQALISTIYLNPNDAQANFQQLQTNFQELQQNTSNEQSPDVFLVDVSLRDDYQISNLQQVPVVDLDLANDLKLAVISMGEVYRVLRSDQTIAPNFIFVPDRQSQDQARQLLEQEGVDLPEDQAFIPVSWMSIQRDSGELEPLPLTRDIDGEASEFIPIFFNPAHMEQEFEQLTERLPELDEVELRPQIANFTALIDTFTNQENADDSNLQKFLELVEFVPIVTP